MTNTTPKKGSFKSIPVCQQSDYVAAKTPGAKGEAY
jgi:hypothetical protein